MYEPKRKPKFIDFETPRSKKLVLAGNARGGTTWLAELINYDQKYRYIFEPFQPLRVPETKSLHGYPYLRPSDKMESQQRIFSQLLRGDLRNPWMDERNYKRVSIHRMIKTIRGGLLLKWFKINFPDVPVVVITRDPLASVKSQIKTGWWSENPEDTDLRTYLDQPNLMEDYLAPFESLIEDNQKDEFSRFLLAWYIKTYVMFSQLTTDDVLAVSFEQLVSNPEANLKKIVTHTGFTYNPKILKFHSQKSSTTTGKSKDKTKKDFLASVELGLNDNQLKLNRKLYEAFEIDRLYTKHKVGS